MSMPAACIDSTSSNAKPSSRSITSTRRLTSVGCGRGTMIPRCSVSARTRAMSSMFCASSRKSSSSMTVSANSSTSAGGFASAATGMRPTSRGASQESAAMSSRKRCATCGRCTLTTTSSPVRSRAACTWAIEAAAMRRLVERLEQFLERTAEVDLHHCPHVGERFRRHLIAQQLELVDQLVGEETLAARDDLAELHVARTEPFEGQPQPAGDPGARRRPAPFEDQPPAERVPDLDQRAAEPAEGREPARREEPGHLAARAVPDALDVPLPRDGVEIEHPRAVIAERAPDGVRGQRIGLAQARRGESSLEQRYRHLSASLPPATERTTERPAERTREGEAGSERRREDANKARPSGARPGPS